MDERSEFVLSYCTGAFTMSELCARFGVSRPTGYKWLERYAQEGMLGLQDRSRAAHHCPHRMAPQMQALLLAQRTARPHWGARKILNAMARRDPALVLPSRSAVNALFARHGLSERRKARRRVPAGAPVQPTVTIPNEVWTIDFKGQFRTGDGRWCYPLTVMDLASRYLLECRGKPSVASAPVARIMHELFARYGLPAAIHSDNGTPFASIGLCGLSRLSVRWLKLGIRVQRSRPAQPQDNGAHERMHRTLKAATARPPAANARAQQRRFDAFRDEYNFERSHETLQDRLPCEAYQPSTRHHPRCLGAPSYPGHFEQRKVIAHGCIKWRGRCVFIGAAFHGEVLGLEEVDDGIWSLYFAHQLLARFDERLSKLFEVPL
ncbi:MAG TPA: DDE-type integrase/transposase/recombinase [Steroidobacteraceae bacterium]|nr:DDE-type integrase/transposase/recombinase [Steroidobacteraceae bacterium]